MNMFYAIPLLAVIEIKGAFLLTAEKVLLETQSFSFI